MSRKRSRRAARRRRRRILRVFLLAAALAAFFILFQLRTVVVSGNLHNGPSEITDLILERPVLGNTVLAKLFNTNRKISGPGFVDAVNVHIVSRDKIRVSVSERRFVGRVLSGELWYYFDVSGAVMAQAAEPRTDDGIPPVEGLAFVADVEIGKKLPIVNTKIFAMLGMLRNRAEANPKMVPERVVFGENSAMSLVYGPVTVLLGNGEKLEMRLKELSAVLTQLLSGYSGTLHLENYDGSQNGLVFDPG